MKIGIAIIHGIGNQLREFHYPVKLRLENDFKQRLGNRIEAPEKELVIKPVYWADVLKTATDFLWQQINEPVPLNYYWSPEVLTYYMRQFLVYFMGDAIAYQPTVGRVGRSCYDAVHYVYAKALQEIADEAGENAPLCIIAHSLGTIITSNYLYDLQKYNENPEASKISTEIKDVLGRDNCSPLERGQTLNLLYTMGSPISIWSLRYENFGDPIDFPPPNLKQHHKKLFYEWVNFYDKDDPIAFPLRNLRGKYDDGRVKDRQVNVGTWRQFWNPTSHMGYWLDGDIIEQIGYSLAKTWRQVNP